MDSALTYLTFNEVGTTIAAIAAACGFIALVWNAIKAIKEWISSLRKPTDDHINDVEAQVMDHEKRIEHLEGCCTDVKNKLKSDWEFQQEEIDMNRLMLKSIKTLLQHAVDGNHKDNLVRREQEIDQYLLDHVK